MGRKRTLGAGQRWIVAAIEVRRAYVGAAGSDLSLV